jgi:3-deoxy-7-phosphoheptulonate synthase
MQNYTLLRKVASLGKPVFLKRNPGSTLDEWLGSAEHILTAQAEAGVNAEVYLIERGSSTNLNHVRWDLSISMIPAIKEITQLPVIVDGSHGTGRNDLVFPMTMAGVAAGAAGCLVEVHPNPRQSLSDADQAIGFKEYEYLMKKVNEIKGVTDAMYKLQF